MIGGTDWGWTWNSGTGFCEVSASDKILLDTSQDALGGMVVSPTGTQTCNWDGQASITTNGAYTANQVVTVTQLGGTPITNFFLRSTK